MIAGAALCGQSIYRVQRTAWMQAGLKLLVCIFAASPSGGFLVWDLIIWYSILQVQITEYIDTRRAARERLLCHSYISHNLLHGL